MSAHDNEIWVFVSHSNKDYEKVIQVRNILEQLSLRPLLFFLKCLNDEDEIDDLIKREIDSRGRFILCDSENARKSSWVQKEIAYIQSRNRIYQRIDLDATIEKITDDLVNFKKNSTVFISCALKDTFLYEQFSERLRSDWDFAIFDVNGLTYGQDWEKQIKLAVDQALTNGYMFFLITDTFLNSPFCMAKLKYALESGDKNERIVILKEKNVSIDHLSLKIPDSRLFNMRIHKTKLEIDFEYLYWEFMQTEINEGMRRNDPNALYLFANHYYSDDRFDLPNMTGMRIAVASAAKKASDKGHREAALLYNLIMGDYPEIEKEIQHNNLDSNEPQK